MIKSREIAGKELSVGDLFTCKNFPQMYKVTKLIHPTYEESLACEEYPNGQRELYVKWDQRVTLHIEEELPPMPKLPPIYLYKAVERSEDQRNAGMTLDEVFTAFLNERAEEGFEIKQIWIEPSVIKILMTMEQEDYVH